jgi:ABC-type molybdate transport system substrate-binding protein
VRVVYVVPKDQTQPIVYTLAPIADSKKLAGSKWFVEFLGSGSAQAVFENLV